MGSAECIFDAVGWIGECTIETASE